MLRCFGALLDRACAVIGAIVFAQFPLFISQYEHQLVGREAELRLQVDSMRQAASISGKSLEQFIHKFTASSDLDFLRQGELMQSMVDRWQSLNEALLSLQTSTLVTRPVSFIMHLNGDAFNSTLHNYTFGLPLNAEGGTYALAGIIIGYLLFAGIRRTLNGIVSACRRPFIRAKA